jgi:tetratricopeptide (TPR) repeat protein
MISEYLNLLELNESYIQAVQNRLQATVYNETEGDLQEMLKKNLVIRIQKRPDKIIFVEMLIWLYIQDKDFEQALVQAKSLDKRLGEGSKRVYDIGVLAGDAEQYAVASEAFQYIINKGINDAYYIDAKSDNLSVMYKKVIGSGKYTTAEVQNLEKLFSDALTDLGINKSTFSIAMNKAKLQAFYLNDPDKALETTNQAIESGKLAPLQIAEGKILLGDIYLFKMEIWEATLIYAQVEKMYPNEPIGHDAKLKKARLAYFSGDFQWAEAQLSVLKAATSKLISNDAFGLSMLIKDNMVDDSEGKALLIFSRAEWLHYRRQDSLALLTLDSVISLFPQNVIVDDALYLKGKYYEAEGKYTEACAEYEKVVSGYPYDILADDALYERAMLYYNQLNEPEKARDLFKNLITGYPGSLYISDARRMFRELRDKYPELKTNP